MLDCLSLQQVFRGTCQMSGTALQKLAYVLLLVLILYVSISGGV